MLKQQAPHRLMITLPFMQTSRQKHRLLDLELLI
jgi:hypothetical protein